MNKFKEENIIRSIGWRKEETFETEYGYKALVESETTLRGLAVRGYVFRNPDRSDIVQVTSVLSPVFDISGLLSDVFVSLRNKDMCEKKMKINNMRMKNTEEKHT